MDGAEALDLEIEEGGGNVFADLGLEDAPELKLKAVIVGQVLEIVERRGLTQAQAAAVLGLTQPKVSALKNGKLRGFSLEKLLDMMARLGRDVEISFTKAAQDEGSRIYVNTGSGRMPVAA